MFREPFRFSDKMRTFSNEATEAAFLLGGIGTGNLSIGARGEMRDWEIFNRPNKGGKLPYTFFSIRVKDGDSMPDCRVLEAKLNPPFDAWGGMDWDIVAGLPRFRSSVMRAEYPFVSVGLSDPDLKMEVKLEAFTPFIPLNAADSGIPGAIIRYSVKNISEFPADVTVAASMFNAAAFGGADREINNRLQGSVVNELREETSQKGLFFKTCDGIGDRLECGDLSLVTTNPNTTCKVNWLGSGWLDGIHEFWKDFCEDGLLEKELNLDAVGSEFSVKAQKVGSLGIFETIEPNETKTFEFVLTWFFPNRINGWSGEHAGDGIVKNYYSRLFGSSWEAAKYLNVNMKRLESESRKFHDALFGSTYPGYVLDAISSNITVLRSNTCFRTSDGIFYGWEGCMDREGSCCGNCTHVWNYAQTLAFLFPELEQTMRRVEFGVETDDEGRMAYRTQQTFGLKKWEMPPAADGQPGTIIRLYRDWKISGNSVFLKELWPKASKALDFALSYWDKDGDCVPDDRQHNTYDTDFYGPNPLTGVMLCAALKAGAEMAEYLNDTVHARSYGGAFKKCAANLDEMLWNGEYYEQKSEDIDRYRYQFGKGCLSDQLLGQLLAHVAGLGCLLPEEHVKKAIHSVFKNNYKADFSLHMNAQRTYALNDEKGLLLCTWPHGGRPSSQFVYSDEVWTGIEYQVAAHLIYEGFVEEGLKIVESVRDRYDGYKRNPWDEIECGHHYARSMASWAVLLALSGFRYDMVEGKIGFDPKISGDDFSTFWSTGSAWGVYRQKKNPGTGKLDTELEVLYGDAGAVKLC